MHILHPEHTSHILGVLIWVRHVSALTEPSSKPIHLTLPFLTLSMCNSYRSLKNHMSIYHRRICDEVRAQLVKSI